MPQMDLVETGTAAYSCAHHEGLGGQGLPPPGVGQAWAEGTASIRDVRHLDPQLLLLESPYSLSPEQHLTGVFFRGPLPTRNSTQMHHDADNEMKQHR